MNDPDLKFRTELKALILAAVDKDEPADGLRDDESWFGPESRLELDSLDASANLHGDPEKIRCAYAR